MVEFLTPTTVIINNFLIIYAGLWEKLFSVMKNLNLGVVLYAGNEMQTHIAMMNITCAWG